MIGTTEIVKDSEASICSPCPIHGSNEYPWYAVTVCPRHEKKVVWNLDHRGVRCFVPTYRSVRKWKDRRKELDLVLFPGYVFVQLDLQERDKRLAMLTTPGVLRFVTFHGEPVPVDQDEIKFINSTLTSGIAVSPHPYLQKGRRVRVVRGALAGIEGILVRRKERFRLVLSVNLIMQSVALEVDESEVTPC